MSLPPATILLLVSLYVLWRIEHSTMSAPRKALLGILTVASWLPIVLVF